MMNLINAIPGTCISGDYSLCHTYENPEEGFNKLIKPQKNIVKGGVYVGHVPYSSQFEDWLKKNNFKQIFVYRDPRDYVVSLSNYVTRDVEKKHEYYELYMRISSIHQERFKSIIKGYGDGENKFITSNKSIPNVKIVFNAYKNWFDSYNTISIPFENVVDSRNSNQTFIEILTFLDLKSKYSMNRANNILNLGKDPLKSRTFRKGAIGGWKNVFDEITENLFNDFVGESLNDFMINNKL